MDTRVNILSSKKNFEAVPTPSLVHCWTIRNSNTVLAYLSNEGLCFQDFVTLTLEDQYELFQLQLECYRSDFNYELDKLQNKNRWH